MKSNGLRSFYLFQNGLGCLPGEGRNQTIGRSGYRLAGSYDRLAWDGIDTLVGET